MLSEEAFKRERGSWVGYCHWRWKIFVYREKINMEKQKRSAPSSSFTDFVPKW